MKRRIVETAALAFAFAIVVGIAIAQHRSLDESRYSTFDTGTRGYRVLFEVLKREGVRVDRFYGQPASLGRGTAVLALADTWPERIAGRPYEPLTKADVKALRSFARRGRILVFAGPNSDFATSLRGFSVRLDARRYTNLGLSRDPRAALRVFRLVGERGAVAFDERLHGYSIDRSFWQALPGPVHVAVWIAVFTLVLILVGENVRFAPPLDVAAREDRDSSAYIVSMAALLRRSNGRRLAVERFERESNALIRKRAPGPAARRLLEELRSIAAARTLTDSALVRAAQCYAAIRREFA